MGIQAGRLVGPYRVVEPAWVPEAGMWYLGRGADDTPVLVRIAAADDRVAAEAQHQTLRRIVDPRVPTVLAHDAVSRSFVISHAVGTPLSEAIDQRSEEGGGGVVLTPATLMDVLLQIGRALRTAHAAGVVHGSLDPDRALLSPEGKVWLFGFGSGVEPGTPWLPPEVARGNPPTEQTDQWSLAAIGVGLVLGHPIWPWHTRASIGTPGGAITEGDCSALVATIQTQWPALGRVLGQALAPDPEARYPSMDGFVVALQQLAELAGGSSDRAAMGALLWDRRRLQEHTPLGGGPTAVPLDEVPVAERLTEAPAARVQTASPPPEHVDPSFHRAPTVAVETPPPVPVPPVPLPPPSPKGGDDVSPEPPAPAAVTRIAPVLVAVALVLLLAALGAQLFS